MGKLMEIKIVVEISDAEDDKVLELNNIDSFKLEDACDIIKETLLGETIESMKYRVDDALRKAGFNLNSLEVSIDY